MRRKLISIFLISFIPVFLSCQSTKKTNHRDLAAFEKSLVKLQNQYHLPSLSVAIVSHQKIIYSKGFGFADRENQVAATDTTPSRIASITKPFAASIILNLVEKGKLQLDDRLNEQWPGYTDHFREMENMIREKAPQYLGLIEDYHYDTEDITLRHQLSHTAEGHPGDRFKYSGFLYSELSGLVDAVGKNDFYHSVKEEIILRLQMDRSLPQQADTWRPTVIRDLAKPYYRNEAGEFRLADYPKPNLGAGAGIVSTVTDLAKFDIALDQDRVVSPKMKKMMFTPTLLNNGEPCQYGLGWFIGDYHGHQVVYHTGWQPRSFSGLYLKVPDRELTLILLANSEDLIALFMNGLGEGEIEASPFAQMFLEFMVDE